MTGQPQYPLARILDGMDETIEFLAKEVYAKTSQIKPRTMSDKFNMFVGLKRL
jgi:hypothetical protein